MSAASDPGWGGFEAARRKPGGNAEERGASPRVEVGALPLAAACTQLGGTPMASGCPVEREAPGGGGEVDISSTKAASSETTTALGADGCAAGACSFRT